VRTSRAPGGHPGARRRCAHLPLVRRRRQPTPRRVAPGPSGAAGAIVLVHGVIVSSRYLLPAAVELARDFPVVVLDLPGYGLSAAPPAPPTLATLADAAIGCARASGHDRVTLVGKSFGAQVAVAAAVRHPERVERLLLVGPTVDP
jgi:2-hydroxy-6-oxonona-2,4-dienedioate hydrolase